MQMFRRFKEAVWFGFLSVLLSTGPAYGASVVLEFLKDKEVDCKTIVDHVSITKKDDKGKRIEYKRFRF